MLKNWLVELCPNATSGIFFCRPYVVPQNLSFHLRWWSGGKPAPQPPPCKRQQTQVWKSNLLWFPFNKYEHFIFVQQNCLEVLKIYIRHLVSSQNRCRSLLWSVLDDLRKVLRSICTPFHLPFVSSALCYPFNPATSHAVKLIIFPLSVIRVRRLCVLWAWFLS